MDPSAGPDAQFLDQDAYAPFPGQPDEIAPQGLIDRLYQERLRNRPMTQPIDGAVPPAVPTTKNRFA